MSINTLKQAYKECFDEGDRWGSNMSAWFTISNELAYRGEDIPWDYEQGRVLDPREEDDYMYDVCKEAITFDLWTFGQQLERVDGILRELGENY